MVSPYRDLPCRYLSNPGRRNTQAVLEAVARRMRAAAVDTVLVATRTGTTPLAARRVLGPHIPMIAVTHVTGFRKPDVQDLSAANRKKLEARGITVLTCQHAFAGVGRGIYHKLGTYQVNDIIAHSLKLFGNGTKVAIEMALMAADAGLIRTDAEVISIAGSSRGADTALLLKPANSANFFDLRVREVICKPAQF